MVTPNKKRTITKHAGQSIDSERGITQPLMPKAAQRPPVNEGETVPLFVQPEGETLPVSTLPPQPVESAPPPPSSHPTQPFKPLKAKKPKTPRNWNGFWKRGLLVVVGIVIMVLLGGAGGWMGYQTAVNNRLGEQDQKKVEVAVTQYQLGLADLQAGRIETARQRFEYVIRIDPGFPGASQKLAEAMLAIATQLVPTVGPTPTLMPTPDNRGVDEKYATAVQLIQNQKWDDAVNVLMGLRKTDINYKPVLVDGFLYSALRQRGVGKISSGSLEPGIYDLALAENFAPLDRDADGFRNIARLYIIGASFWGVDWGQAYDYFKQVAAGNSGLVDSSGYTAGQRLAYAAAKIGDTVYATGDYCEAKNYYSQSNGAKISNIGATATKAAYDCAPPTSSVTVTVTITPTLGGTVAATATTVGAATTAVPIATTAVVAATATPVTPTPEAPTATPVTPAPEAPTATPVTPAP